MLLRDYEDYREILRAEMQHRCSHNPRYSQGAFARDLKFKPHRLSQVLLGRFGLSRKAACDVAARLGFDRDDTAYFCDLVDKDHARSPSKRRSASLRIHHAKSQTESNRIKETAFEVIAEWYHFAILELLEVKRAKKSPRALAQALGITELEARTALERLQRLDLVRKGKGGALVLTHRSNWVPSGPPSAAIKRFHTQVLEKSASALHLYDVSRREYCSAFLAIEASDLPEAKKRVQNFWRELGAALNARKPVPSDNGSDQEADVYCLAVQLFPTTTLTHE